MMSSSLHGGFAERNNSRLRLGSKRLAVTLSKILACGLLASAWAAAQNPEPPLAITDLDIQPSAFQVKLKLTNVSDRPVTAFRLEYTTHYRGASPAVNGHSGDYAGALEDGKLKDSLLPGEEVEVSLSPPRLPDAGPPLDVEVKVESVVFEGDGFYGSESFLRSTYKYREERFLETTFWINRLQEASQADDIRQALEQVDSDLRSIVGPAFTTNPSPSNAYMGTRNDVGDFVATLLRRSKKPEFPLDQVMEWYLGLLAEQRDSLGRNLPVSKRPQLK